MSIPWPLAIFSHVPATLFFVVVTVNGFSSNSVNFTVIPGNGTTVLADSMGRTTIYGERYAKRILRRDGCV